ncbi:MULTISPECIES: helix-turn-helix domain-containing protein [unclassified Mameliella]|uniref:helix-turn-helix domain-containing protein n=1 Tax=unclassified Mameliella TaxID=2630630 RepID=UPI00273EFFEB|nr:MULTISPECIES: helix-turn-helix domain-containing protein [unclassified Mameliella]
MADNQTNNRGILDDDRVFFPEDPEMRLFGSVEKLAQWRHRNRGPAFIRIGRRIAYHGSDLNAYLEAQRVDPNGEAV